MPSATFEKPGALLVERRRHREGPPVDFLVWLPGTSFLCPNDRKAVLKAVKWPSKTPTGDALRAWLTEWEQHDASAPATPFDSERIAAEGFGPEAHEEPNDSTRTII